MAAVKKPKAKKAAGEDLLDLPFDQYSRQYVVSAIINEALRSAGKLNVIDLGGHKGKTSSFMPKDDVTILDVFDESYPGYVQGDASNMTFDNETFDVACSFDVFEHIPRNRRLDFIKEALRVTRLGVFIAMPVDEPGGAVSQAETLLNETHKTLYGTDHQWLKEHIDYRIPNDKEVRALITKAGATCVSFASNQVTDWQLLQTVIFIAARNPHATLPAARLNRWYNQHIQELEKGVDVGYRGIYFVSRSPQVVAKVEKAVTKLLANQASAARYIPVHQGVLEQTVRAVADIAASFEKLEAHAVKLAADRQELHDQLKETIGRLQEMERSRDAHASELASVYASSSWRLTKPLRAAKKRTRK